MKAAAIRERTPALGAVMAALVLASGLARGDENHRYPLSSAYKDECGSCHVPYPPQLLTARSWNSVMAGLGNHFGSDASLEPAKAKEIAGYLAANAARSDRLEVRSAQPRITETSWFRRKHRDGHDGLTAAVWKSSPVGSPANCGACHPTSSEGNYGEGDIRIPRIK